MNKLSDKNPCDTCTVDRQIGNPYRWQCECDRCQKPYEWKKECVNRLSEYESIGTVEECRVSRERQIPRKPKHFYKKYGKHIWKRKENGEIDDFAFDVDYHSGVICERCGEAVCTLCNPNYDELSNCEVERWDCPNCGKWVLKRGYCEYCGQALDWSDTP